MITVLTKDHIADSSERIGEDNNHFALDVDFSPFDAYGDSPNSTASTSGMSLSQSTHRSHSRRDEDDFPDFIDDDWFGSIGLENVLRWEAENEGDQSLLADDTDGAVDRGGS